MYNWQRPDWPLFRQDAAALATPLAAVRLAQGRLLGRMEALGFEVRGEAMLRTLTEEVVKTSEIEGEILSRSRVRSSVANHLGLDAGGVPMPMREVDGIVEMMLDATRNAGLPLTEDRLFSWHAALFPTGRSRLQRIRVGGWRDDADGPMEIVSGPIGRSRVHCVAPPAERIEKEMSRFLEWFEEDRIMDPLLAAGLAHLWFVSIHPFDDGNGRIARAVAELVLVRSDHSPDRFYSMSSQICAERRAYYENLQATDKNGLDVTNWQTWFLGCLGRAIGGAQHTLAGVLNKARFWETRAGEAFNPRQAKILNRLLDGFEGKLTSSLWARIGHCSQDTAGRDIRDLVNRGILVRGAAGGRSTSYELAGYTPGRNE